MLKIKIHSIDAYHFCFEFLESVTKEEIIQFFHLSKKMQKTVQFPSKDHYDAKERIYIYFPVEPFESTNENSIDLIYEDEMVLVVNKPPFLLVHSDGQTKDTLQDRVNAYLYQTGWCHKAQAIQRIDYETSGLVIFSKNPFFQPCFDYLIASHQIKKQYLCIVEGLFPHNTITINKPISRNRHNAKAMIVHPKGKEAISIIQCLKKSKNRSLLKVDIKTGRKHQIRVHCSSLGYPIMNDKIYGHVFDQRGLLLQNQSFTFIHPIYRHKIELHLEMDPRFTKEFDKKFGNQ